jgi:hypothetical protein
MDSSLSV